MPEVTELAGRGARPGTWSFVCLFWDREVSRVTSLEAYYTGEGDLPLLALLPLPLKCRDHSSWLCSAGDLIWASCMLGKLSATELYPQCCTEIFNHYNAPPVGWVLLPWGSGPF